jgi:hypothetical protein
MLDERATEYNSELVEPWRGERSEPTNTPTPRHKTAIAYARAGIKVFPCVPGGKEPAVKGGFHTASSDPAQIDAWWGENPDYNLAIEPEAAGWCVVDLDGEEGIGTAEALGLSPALTRSVATPSGGLHLYFNGSLPPSVRKLGPGIDTRGQRSYVLVPPSVVNGKPYIDRGGKQADLPAWVTERLGSVERPKLAAPDGIELDTPENVARARSYLARILKAEGPWGQEDPPDTFAIAATVKDLGLSPEKATDLMMAELSEDEREWLTKTVENAFEYGQNEPGAYAVSSGTPAAWQAIADQEPGETGPAPQNRFRGRWPDEFEALPDLAFWDEEKTLPKSPDGCVVILYGDFGTGKTNVVLTMLFDAVLHREARACYAAGEGAHGVGKDRIPAHCKARGIATRDLRGKFRIVSGVPLFASPSEVQGFIDAQQDLAPEIIVIDTLATAIAGEDENGSRAAAFLTDNGPAGQIKRAFNALVILPAHSGKDTARGIRGNSGFGGNADVILHLEADKPSGAIKLTVAKMRDGRDGFSVYFKVPPAGTPGVPVPVKITEGEYVELVKGSAAGSLSPTMVFNQRKRSLLSAGAFGFNKGLTERLFAERLIGPEPSPDDLSATAEWETSVEKERKALQNAHSKPKYKGVLCDEQMPEGVTGQGKMQWRWFLAEREAAREDDF